MASIAGLQTISLSASPPAGYGQYVKSASAVVFRFVWSGVTYWVSMQSGEGGWTLIAVDQVPETTVNATFTALGAGARVVLMDETFPLIAAGFAFTANNQVLEGQGRGTFIDGDALLTTVHAINLSGFDDCIIRNISVQTEDGGTKTCHCIFIEDGCNGFIIDNVTIVDSDSDGVHIEGTTIERGWILNSTILDVDDNGIDVDMDAANNVFYLHLEGNLITSAGLSGISFGATGAGFLFEVIANNIVYSCGNDGFDLAELQFSIITGNISYNNVHHGIALVNSDNNVVSKNICEENDSGDLATYDGINIDTTSLDNIVTENLCYGNHRYGITSVGARNNILGNHSSLNDRDGIYITGTESLISQNYVYNNGQDAAGTYHGIHINTNKTSVIGNFINSNAAIQEDCIYIAAGHDHFISGNYCYRGMGSGITLVADVDNTFITNNFCYDNDDYGIEIVNANCDNNAVHNNYLLTNVTGQLLDNGTLTDKEWNWCGGPVYNSEGCGFATVQESITDLGGDGWVRAPAGTWDERLTLPNADVILFGEGWSTIIHQTTEDGHAITVNADNCIVRDLQVVTTPGGTNDYDGISTLGGVDNTLIENVFVNGSDRDCIAINGGSNNKVVNCYALNADRFNIFVNGPYSIVSGSTCETSGVDNINLAGVGNNSIITNNIINGAAGDGIAIAAGNENCTVTGNNITGWTNEPIDDDSATSVVWNNNAGGSVLTSKGCGMATIALAITYVGAGGWIEIPSGTYSIPVVLDNSNVILRGQGWTTIIDGGTTGHAISITGNNCLVRDLSVTTTPGATNNYDGVNLTGDDCELRSIFVNGADRHGIYTDKRTKVTLCYVITSDEDSIFVGGEGNILTGNTLRNAGNHHINIGGLGDDAVVGNNYLNTSGDDGILIDTNAENCDVDGNRIMNWTNECIDDDSGTSTIGDNECT